MTTIVTLLLICTDLSTAQTVASTIKEIEIKYKFIKNNLHSYDSIKRNISEETKERGIVIGYYDKKDLKLITVWFYGENGKRKADYYFDNNELNVVEEIYYSYNRPVSLDNKKTNINNDTIIFNQNKTEINEYDKYYFKGKKLISWINKDGSIIDNKLAAYKGRAIEIPMMADELKDKLK